jgi:hypothetical protein
VVVLFVTVQLVRSTTALLVALPASSLIAELFSGEVFPLIVELTIVNLVTSPKKLLILITSELLFPEFPPKVESVTVAVESCK